MSTLIFPEDNDYTDTFTFICECGLFKDRLHNYNMYFQQTEQAFKQADKELQKELIEKIETSKSEDEKEHWYQSYGWDLSLQQSEYPSILRESLFISLYNLLEFHLNHLCEMLEPVADHNFTYKDVAGQGYQRAITFLQLTLAFEKNDLPENQFLSEANRIRNRIVHGGSILSSSPTDRINKFIASHTHLLGGSPGYRIVIKSEFIEECMDRMGKLFQYLSEQSIEYHQVQTGDQAGT